CSRSGAISGCLPAGAPQICRPQHTGAVTLELGYHGILASVRPVVEGAGNGGRELSRRVRRRKVALAEPVDGEVANDTVIRSPEVRAEDEGGPVGLQLADESVLAAVEVGPWAAHEVRLDGAGGDGKAPAGAAGDVNVAVGVDGDPVGAIVVRPADQCGPDDGAARRKFRH